MAQVKVTQAHQLSVDEARQRMQGFEDMIKKYGVRTEWKGSKAAIKGTGVSGSIEVGRSKVDVVVKLGMLARAAGVDAKRLEGSIRRRLVEAFEG